MCVAIIMADPVQVNKFLIYGRIRTLHKVTNFTVGLKMKILSTQVRLRFAKTVPKKLSIWP